MADLELESWANAIDEFPITGTAQEKLRALVGYAVLAPSTHNSQPWLYRLTGASLDLYADWNRGLAVVDPENRELTISCGAALEALEVALRHFGYEGDISLVPDPRNRDLLARVRLGQDRCPTAADHASFAALPNRRTYRLPFDNRVVEQALLQQWQRAARSLGGWFRVLTSESSRQSLIELISEGDRIQMDDPAFRGELAAWMHSNRSGSRDGMPGFTHGLGELASLTAPLVIRSFDIGNGQAARDRQLAMGSPVLSVLGTDRDTPHDWLRTGRALMRILLLAEGQGVAASYLNQPVEVPALRIRLGGLLGKSGYPQLVLRMGYAARTSQAAPRRPVSEVLRD